MEQNQLYLIKSGQNSFVETEGEVTIGLSGGNIGFGTTAPEAFMHVTGNTQIDGDLTVKGNFTTVDSTTIQVDDKNIEIGVGATTDAAADGGGITLHGATNKTITWSDANDAWTSSEHVRTADGKHVATDQVRALDGDGLKLYDDGGNGIFVEDGGNVGIGTSNPSATLDVVGAGSFSASVSAGSSVDATTTMSAGTSLTTPLVKAAGAAGLNLQDDGGNGIFVEDGGNVGIGTSDPSVALDVVGAGSFSTSVSAGSSVDATTTMSAGTSLTTPLVKAADGNGLNLQDDGGNGIFVEDGGNVGIGTSDPSATLDVVGSGNFSAGLYVNGNAVVTGDAGKWSDGVGANEIYYSAGNVGVGTSDPSSALDVVGVGNFSQGLFVGGNAVVTGSAGKWSDGVGTDEIYYSAANVGIGTSNPAASLDVGGLFQVGSNGTIGGVSPSSDHVIKWNGSKWISATSPGGGGAGSSEVPSAFTTNLLSSNGAIHQISFAETYDSIPSIATDLEVTEGPIIPYAISGLSTAGYYAVFTQDIPSDNNYKIHTTFGGKEVYWATGVASTAVVYDGGNVGIGTTDPSVALDVVGAGSFSTSVSAGSSVDATTTMSAGTSLTTPLVKAAGGAGLNLQDDGGNGIFIKDGGNVGIGTTNPSELLEVHSEGATAAIEISAGKESTTTGEAKLVLRSLHASSGTSYSRSEIASLGIAGGDSDLIFRTTTEISGPEEHMRIRSNGNVGIGTTNPSTTLNVVDSHGSADGIAFFKNESADFGMGVKIEAGGNTDNERYALRVDNAAGDTLLFCQSKTGNVGIGTANPVSKLEVNLSNGTYISAKESAINQVCGYAINGNSGTQTAIFSSDTATGEVRLGATLTNYYQTFYANNLERMRITSAGNVGIGTSNPVNALHVSVDHANNYAARVENTTTSGANGLLIRHTNSAADSNATYFLTCHDSSSARLRIYSDGDVQNHDGTYGQLSSDLRLKENVVDAPGKLEDLMSLEVKNYNFIGEDKKMIGFVAQDFEKVFPSLVTTTDTREYDDDGNVTSGFEDTRGMKVGMEFAILTKAIQEQQQIIEDLKSRIETLEQ